jgi:hypothetical protein
MVFSAARCMGTANCKSEVLLQRCKSVSSCTLPVLRPTTCICLRTSTSTTTARCPRPRRRTSPPCRRARAHSRRTRTRRAVLGVQQALEEILQHLVLRLPRRTRCTARAPTTTTATAFHLSQRALNRRQREGRRTQRPDEACGGNRGVHRTAENATRVAVGASRVLVVVLREEGLFRCRIVERWEWGRL